MLDLRIRFNQFIDRQYSQPTLKGLISDRHLLLNVTVKFITCYC